MKKTLLPAVFIALIASLVICANAHPGKTDGNGGHTDHSTGEYHYHHGYSEHDHYDMDGDGDLDCPYEFKGTTNNNTTDSSNAPSAKQNSATKVPSKKDSPSDLTKIVVFIVITYAAFFVSFFIVAFVDQILSRFNIETSGNTPEIMLWTVYILLLACSCYLIAIW